LFRQEIQEVTEGEKFTMKCENQVAAGKHLLAAGTVLLLAALCGALLLAACGGGGGTTTDSPQVKTTAVNWDSANQHWVDTAKSVQAVTGSSSSTLVVELPPEEAVKQVVVREVQLVNSPTEPTLLIAGQDDSVTGSSGSITICRLVIRKVDIEELIVENVQASRVTVVDFASEHGLDITLNPVNVIRCGRGGVGVLALGAETTENVDLLDPFPHVDVLGAVRVFSTEGKEGVRMNQVAILGPQGFDGFIETLIIDHSSVFGLVELRNLKIKELIIDSVTVDH
jgi:hypothetical protein